MEIYLKLIFLSIFLALIDGNTEKDMESSETSAKNQTLIDRNSSNSGNKSSDLVTSDQHFSYNWLKERDDSYDNYNNYDTNGKTYLKEVQYFRDREIVNENKRDWDSDKIEEISSKKAKKDLYNKRQDYNKPYGKADDMIEVRKWDDEELPNIRHSNYDNNEYNNNFNANNKNRNNYNNFDSNKSQIKFETNINHNNNNQNYKSDGNKDNNNYNNNRIYGAPPESSSHEESDTNNYSNEGYDENNQKWFTNMEDKDQSGSTDSEVKDEDNYNNYNSPKFVVNFQNFKPWNQLMRNRRHEDSSYDSEDNNQNQENSYEIYKNSQSSAEDGEDDDKFNYKPKLLTDFSQRIRHQNNDNNRDDNNNNNFDNNYNKNKIFPNDRQMRYKSTDFKETVKKLKSKPRTMRYHYEKRVVPQIYSTSRPKSDEYDGRGYDSGPSNMEYMSHKTGLNRRFIEMPYDMLNTGWSSVQKPLRQRSTPIPKVAVPKVRQFRIGF